MGSSGPGRDCEHGQQKQGPAVAARPNGAGSKEKGGECRRRRLRSARLLPFWAAVFVLAGGVESQSFNRASFGGDGALEEGEEPGDIGYDPLGLLPTDPEELEEIQNKEILNGRFAMISLLGMVAEE